MGDIVLGFNDMDQNKVEQPQHKRLVEGEKLKAKF